MRYINVDLPLACSRSSNRGWRWAKGGVLHGNHRTFLNHTFTRRDTSDSVIGVVALCCRGDHRILLEPPIRSHWPQARSLVLPRGYDCFNDPVRTLSFVLDHRHQVPSSPPLARRFNCGIHPFVPRSRCLHGALKGNIGVVKSAMAELTDESNVARGFSSLQMAWSIGYVIGLDTLPIVPCLR